MFKSGLRWGGLLIWGLVFLALYDWTVATSQPLERMAVPVELETEIKAQFAELQAQLQNRSLFQRVAKQSYRREALIGPEDRDPLDVVLRRTRALLSDLKARQAPNLAKLEAELTDLQGRAQASVNDGAARTQLFADACRLRRRIAFANPLLNFDKLVFIKRHPSKVSHMCDQFFGYNARPGGGLFVLGDVFAARPTLGNVLANSQVASGRLQGQRLEGGAFLSPDLAYDGQTVLFAYAECAAVKNRHPTMDSRLGIWDAQSAFHVFRVKVDGSDLRQLTDGSFNDFDPCWLPNGRVVFISERRGGFGRCHGERPVPTYTLHTMKADGSDLACISFHETNEWHPSVNHDGMIVYTRWDYVDRGTNQAHHPWITTPDGRNPRAIQGNYPAQIKGRPWMEMDIQPIPGSRKYVSVAAAHHGQAYGSLVLLDSSVVDDDGMAPLRRITPEVLFPESEGGRGAFATPWPLSEDYYLCAYAPAGYRPPAGTDKAKGRFSDNRQPIPEGSLTHGLYLVDSFGNKELLYRDAAIGSLNPIPLRSRLMPPVVADGYLRSAIGNRPANKPTADSRRPIAEPATVTVSNVYDSRNDWPADTRITALRIIQVLPKSTPASNSPRMGYAHQTVARAVLGTVPVEADGSAHFLVPPGKEVYFQALDDQGLAIQSMRSGTYFHPGEKAACQGCHDRRDAAPTLSAQSPLALQRTPSVIQPEAEGSRPFNFVRLVQPVLDRHCVACHAKEGALDLSGTTFVAKKGVQPKDKKITFPGWSTSYVNLQGYAFWYNSPRPGNESRTRPGQFGARASQLYRLLAAGHHDLKLPAADLRRLTLWLDANSDFFGAFENPQAQARGEVVWPALE